MWQLRLYYITTAQSLTGVIKVRANAEEVVMPHPIIDELFSSLTNLEQVIEETKKTLQHGSEPRHDIVQRLKCYEEVLHKQKVLAQALSRHLADQNWDQVRRHVDLIRGSSLLIQLDSESIISSMISGTHPEKADLYQD